MARLSAKITKTFKIPNDPDGTALTIYHLKPGEIQKLEAETSKWIGESVNDQFVSKLEYQPTVQLRKLRMAALVGWKGFYDADDIEAECNARNKELFLNEDPILGEGEDEKPLSLWIDQFRKELADSLRPQEEEAEKN